MASIEQRPTVRDGKPTGTVNHRVIWRRAGVKEYVTFHEETEAKQAKSLIEGLRGDVDPDTVYRRVYGLPDPEPAAPDVVTFGTYAAQWWPRKTGVQEDTVERYKRNYELHVADVVIGGRRLADYPIDLVTPAVLAAWVKAVGNGPPCEHCGAGFGEACALLCQQNALDFAGRRRGMTAPTMHRVHAVIHQLLRDAARDPNIPLDQNPAAYTRLPREDVERDDQVHVYLSHAEAQLLIAQLGSELARDVVVFLLGTGLRWSEMSALQTRDVDLLAAVPHIKVQRAWKHSRAKGWHLGPPKSKRSRRTVTVSPELVEILTRRVDLSQDEAYVFTSPGGKRLDNGNARRDWWDPAVRAANGLDKRGEALPAGEKPATLLGRWPTPHDMRHTHASWLIEAGNELVRVSRRLGHDSTDFTARTYVHIHHDGDTDLLSGLDLALKPPQVASSSE